MNTDIFEHLQQRWGLCAPLPPVIQVQNPASGEAATSEQQPMPEDSIPLAPAEEAPKYSCEWVGRNIIGKASVNPERDVARLKEIMRQYPIRPHLREGGGSGFSYPYSAGWSARHWDILGEFSDLWFTEAGDLIIALYGNRMRVIPQKDWRKTVHVQPWLPESAISSGPGGTSGSGPAPVPSAPQPGGSF